MRALCIALCFFSTPGFGTEKPEKKKERVTIKTVVGNVKVISPDSTKTKKLRVGMRVPVGWQVRTSSESWVELMFESGTVIRLGESSVITLSEKVKEEAKKDKEVDKSEK